MTISDINKFTGRTSSRKTRNSATANKRKKGNNKNTNAYNLMRFKELEGNSIFDSLSFNTKRKVKLRKIRNKALSVSRSKLESEEKDKDYKDLPQNFIEWKEKCSPAESQVKTLML